MRTISRWALLFGAGATLPNETTACSARSACLGSSPSPSTMVAVCPPVLRSSPAVSHASCLPDVFPALLARSPRCLLAAAAPEPSRPRVSCQFLDLIVDELPLHPSKQLRTARKGRRPTSQPSQRQTSPPPNLPFRFLPHRCCCCRPGRGYRRAELRSTGKTPERIRTANDDRNRNERDTTGASHIGGRRKMGTYLCACNEVVNTAAL